MNKQKMIRVETVDASILSLALTNGWEPTFQPQLDAETSCNLSDQEAFGLAVALSKYLRTEDEREHVEEELSHEDQVASRMEQAVKESGGDWKKAGKLFEEWSDIAADLAHDDSLERMKKEFQLDEIRRVILFCLLGSCRIEFVPRVGFPQSFG